MYLQYIENLNGYLPSPAHSSPHSHLSLTSLTHLPLPSLIPIQPILPFRTYPLCPLDSTAGDEAGAGRAESLAELMQVIVVDGVRVIRYLDGSTYLLLHRSRWCRGNR